MIQDAYYDAVRKLLASGDAGKVIVSVGFGSSGATNATQLTDAVIVPVESISFDGTNPRKLLVNWKLPRHMANGLAIREIGLLTADGTVIARRTRSAIEKTTDMELGDIWELDV
jgi:hypothetical protein